MRPNLRWPARPLAGVRSARAPLAGALIGLAALVGVGVGIGCAKSEKAVMTAPPPSVRQDAPVSTCAPSQAVVDPVLFAFLSKASAVHHKADLLEDGKDIKGVIAALDELVNGLHPGGASPPPEVAEVLADTRARLAELRSRDGAVEAALADVEAGLGFAVQPSHFRGRLFEVKGVVLERRMAALRARGDEAGAKRAKADAIEAFDRAIEIQNHVIADALRDGAVAEPAASAGAKSGADPGIGGRPATVQPVDAKPARAKPAGPTP